MELKKNPKADLEKRRGLFLEIGLVVAMAAALVAFEMKSYDKEDKEQANALVKKFQEIFKDSIGDIKPLAPQVSQKRDEEALVAIPKVKV